MIDPKYLPTPEEIEAAKAAISNQWSANDRAKRHPTSKPTIKLTATHRSRRGRTGEV